MILSDMKQRVRAVQEIGSSFMVEAGAGSGKTSLMAARVVFMLASGTAPKNIAAITFTEAAASELMGRVRKGIEFGVNWMPGDKIGKEWQTAFPEVITETQKRNLEKAQAAVGSLTITTIHGFCQKLIKPYPVEASIDPGATIIAGQDADLAFNDVFEKWVREELSQTSTKSPLIIEMISHDPGKALPAIRSIADAMRDPADITVSEAIFDATVTEPYLKAAKAFLDWNDALPFWQDVDGQHVDIVEATRTAYEAVSSLPVHLPHLVMRKIVELGLDSAIFTASDGTPKQYRCKGKWQKAAGKGNGESHYNDAKLLYEQLAEEFIGMREKIASCAVYMLRDEVSPLITAYQDHKRAAAVLDFDDLLRSALEMLQSYPEVRSALSNLYKHILVDEYQDTDRIQTEILKLLCFETIDGQYRPRPGALFLVGDAKQAIYRFRGADLETYLTMRNLLRQTDPDCILTINMNFRSQAPILEYVNSVFEEKFAISPGFERLVPFHDTGSELGIPAVSWFPVDGGAEPGIVEWRKGEAQAVAAMCKQLIGSYPIRTKTGDYHKCRPGDIAFLVPQGTDLWVYENALEDAGIPVASQAGKGMFRQQEVQDMIALTRILADERDTLALGAFLRGPLIGLTEQELLDQSHLLGERDNGSFNFLHVNMDTSVLTLPLLKETIERLKELRSNARGKSPHDTLNDAVDRFMVRQKVRVRFRSSPERRLANIDRYLDLSTGYAVRGFRAFSDAMRAAWEDAEKTSEGRPDGQEDAISFITMHSAKGLEWPVVFPINTMTSFLRPPPLLKNSAAGTMSLPFLGIKPSDYADAVIRNDMENRQERLRLWYVAMTRAQNLLILPKMDGFKTRGEAWSQLLEIDTDVVPQIDLSHIIVKEYEAPEASRNEETAESFAARSVELAIAQTPNVEWITPSKHDGSMARTARLSLDEIMDATPNLDPYANIRGGRERGNILHKLMEEVLTGETGDSLLELKERAKELIEQVVAKEMRDLDDLNSAELARCVSNTLALPLIANLRPRLVPELGVSSRRQKDEKAHIMYGIIDAAEVMPPGPDGKCAVTTVIDWKSDINPAAKTVQDYVEQVRTYLDAKGIENGLIVFMTTGKILELSMAEQRWAA